MPLISVVVPCYNAGPYLGDCLASLRTQTYPGLEIILVDDGSTDDSLAIAEAMAKEDGRIRVMRQENAGVSAARNAGATLAQGAYLLFVDADDTLTPEALATLLAAAQGQDIVSACHREVYEDGGTRVFRPDKRCRTQGQILQRLITGDSVYNSMCNKLYRRSFWTQWSLSAQPGLRIGEDALLNLTAYARAQSVIHLPAVTYEYRIRKSSAMQGIRSQGHLDAHLPWLTGVRDVLSALGLRERYFRTYCYSFVLRMHRQYGFTGLLRRFHDLARPAVLAGVQPAALPLCARPLHGLVRAGLFPAVYVLIYPAQRCYHACKKIGRYAAHAARKLLGQEVA